jgi:uncharacterized protein
MRLCRLLALRQNLVNKSYNRVIRYMFYTTELFSIPYNDYFIVYAPLRRLALLVNANVVNLLYQIKSSRGSFQLNAKAKKALKPFIQLGLLSSRSNAESRVAASSYAPNCVTLFLTTKCNLRCIYCYASGGERKRAVIPLEICKAAIDLAVRNALGNKQQVFEVNFHGGGEPTIAWSELTKSVEYALEQAKKNGIRVEFTIASNGVISRNKINWIIKHINGLSISLDGLEETQDSQRPMVDGRGTFQQVMATLLRMDTDRFPYSIRSTVTSTSTAKMAAFTDYIGRRCRPKQLHFEPTFICGRCKSFDVEAPLADEFIEGFRESTIIGERYGIPLVYSGARLENITNSFCRAAGESFCVTPDGDVTSCYEVCSREDPRSEVFFYGKYDAETKRFNIAQDKIAYLKKRTVDNLPFCADCYCKYHCAGDCLVKSTDTNNIFEITNTIRCKINRSLTLDQIIKVLKTPTGVLSL